ncbi:hypothetical protein BU17DRAFT_97089 [Hysterangium stoloniferum]|nr:hypothetical protein BU17DRAFT_97089 [Hysterangium stoloniferum]
MQNSEVPPAYTEYPTKLPDKFPIGEHNVQPLVNVTELQAHLRLLGAIHALKQKVQAQQVGIAAEDRNLAWIVYVNRAVHRFYKWTETSWVMSSPGLNETTIPPLDVVMVWHSYLLNPRAYYEDSMRMPIDSTYASHLKTIQDMPLTLISSLIDPQSLEPLPPSAKRRRFFEDTTSWSFTPPLILDRSDTLSEPLTCPRCLALNYSVKWVAAGEKGYAQPKFEHRCESCGDIFTKESIGIMRFAMELTKKREGQTVYLSETLLDPKSGEADFTAAEAFIKRLFETPDDLFKMNKPIQPKEIAEQAQQLARGLGYSYSTLLTKLHYSVRPKFTDNPGVKPLPRIQRLAAAYSNSGPGLASIDLVGAVLRQGGFIDKMVGLGWTEPNRFDHPLDSAPLVRSVARYHAFLDLMQEKSTTFFVPTLDIDLSWHSHQLKSSKYREDTQSCIGRTPNHDDNIEAQILSTAYDITAKEWRNRFGVPYSVCGCVVDRRQESLIRRIVTSLSRIGSKKEEGPPPPLTPVNNRPDIICTEEDEAESSHPSEHNVQFGDPSAPETQQHKDSRREKTQRRVASAKKRAARDPWRALQAKRNETRDRNHREAFMDDPYRGYRDYYLYWGVSMTTPYGCVQQSTLFEDALG